MASQRAVGEKGEERGRCDALCRVRAMLCALAPGAGVGVAVALHPCIHVQLCILPPLVAPFSPCRSDPS